MTPGQPARDTVHGAARPVNIIPAAYYDLSARLDAAYAVVFCISQALPDVELDPVRRACLDHADNLVAAAQDILTLARADCQALDAQLSALGKSA